MIRMKTSSLMRRTDMKTSTIINMKISTMINMKASTANHMQTTKSMINGTKRENGEGPGTRRITMGGLGTRTIAMEGLGTRRIAMEGPGTLITQTGILTGEQDPQKAKKGEKYAKLRQKR